MEKFFEEKDEEKKIPMVVLLSQKRLSRHEMDEIFA